jgi:hypothetical protein
MDKELREEIAKIVCKLACNRDGLCGAAFTPQCSQKNTADQIIALVQKGNKIKFGCESCIHCNVCVLRQTLDIEKFRMFFGSYIDFTEKLASICSEFKINS